MNGYDILLITVIVVLSMVLISFLCCFLFKITPYLGIGFASFNRTYKKTTIGMNPLCYWLNRGLNIIEGRITGFYSNFVLSNCSIPIGVLF